MNKMTSVQKNTYKWDNRYKLYNRLPLRKLLRMG